jgi:exonuclease III
MRIVAYNFLSGGSARRSGHWSRLLKSFTPDLVLAQECRPPEASPNERYRPGRRDAFTWQSTGTTRWGSGLLARGVAMRPIVVPDYSGWVVGGELNHAAWSTQPLKIFSIHGPVGERGYIRTMHEILDRIVALRGRAELVLGGDFNVVVGYRQPREKLKVQRGEREILERLAQELELVSCWQAANPGRPLAQTLRWTADRTAPYHCDGIFVPRSWLARLRSCRVVRGARWNLLSDHNPVLAEFAGDAGI